MRRDDCNPEPQLFSAKHHLHDDIKPVESVSVFELFYSLPHITTPELLAIRLNILLAPSKPNFWREQGGLQHTGHSSAASFPTGPVMADPFISPFGFTI